MKSVFSSQDGKQSIFLSSSMGYLYIYVWIIWKPLFLFKSPSHRWAQTTGTPELHLAQISKERFTVNKTNNSQPLLFVFCGYRGNRYILPFRKQKIIFLNVNRTPVDRQEAMLYKNINK